MAGSPITKDARDLLLRYLAQLAESGESEIYLSADGARTLQRVIESPNSAMHSTGSRSEERTASASVGVERTPPPRARASQAPQSSGRATPDVPEPEVVEVELAIGPASNSPDMFTEVSPLDRLSSLADVEKVAASCEKCELARGRTKVVFGVGNTSATLMFIGEAPGHDEDLSGIPFVGRAGQLLDKILEAAGIRRDDVYIGNIIKCRPPNNRTPLLTEIEACMPYLAKQIEHIRPKVICTLGLPATQTLLGLKGAMATLRGKVYKYKDMRIIPTYHPAAALRDPKYKRPIWEDFLVVKREYDRV
jgi:uracil-DNA glycosylase family 4